MISEIEREHVKWRDQSVRWPVNVADLCDPRLTSVLSNQSQLVVLPGDISKSSEHILLTYSAREFPWRGNKEMRVHLFITPSLPNDDQSIVIKRIPIFILIIEAAD